MLVEMAPGFVEIEFELGDGDDGTGRLHVGAVAETFSHKRGCFHFDPLKRFCTRVIARIRTVSVHSSPTGLSGPADESDDRCNAVGGLMTIGQLSPDCGMPPLRLLDDSRLGE
jgi:hypothetical protein